VAGVLKDFSVLHKNKMTFKGIVSHMKGGFGTGRVHSDKLIIFDNLQFCFKKREAR
jgi:hypothetical protein